jgi:type I restriction enzyme S subunit
MDRIGNHVTAAKGLSYKGSGLSSEEGLPLHNLNSILEGGGYKHEGLKRYVGEYRERHQVKPGDLIVANTEQGFDHLLIGFAARVPHWSRPQGLYSHHLYKVVPKTTSPLTRTWLYIALNVSWIGKAIRRFSNGTTVNMLPADSFDLPSITVPTGDVIEAFETIATSFFNQQEVLFEQARTLAGTRDLLLPKLMSGEIRVRDAEQIVEDVA